MRPGAMSWLAMALLLVACQSGATPSASLPRTGVPTTSPATTVAPDPPVDPESGLPFIDLDDLPPEATVTVALIESDGPFPHDQDDAVFQNREGILPAEPSGYYREYTVETPGSPDRGARRLVSGADGQLFWTEDHYDSFQRVRQ